MCAKCVKTRKKCVWNLVSLVWNCLRQKVAPERAVHMCENGQNRPKITFFSLSGGPAAEKRKRYDKVRGKETHPWKLIGLCVPVRALTRRLSDFAQILPARGISLLEKPARAGFLSQRAHFKKLIWRKKLLTKINENFRAPLQCAYTRDRSRHKRLGRRVDRAGSGRVGSFPSFFRCFRVMNEVSRSLGRIGDALSFVTARREFLPQP